MLLHLQPKTVEGNMPKRKHVEETKPKDLELQTPLAILLVHKFAWGKLSAAEVQVFADSAIKSGAVGSDLLTLQKLGGFGSSTNNCHRDLVMAFFKNMATPSPMQIETMMKVKNAVGEVEDKKKEVPVILPHQWVNALEERNLLEPLTCSRKVLQDFWNKQDWKGHPQLHSCKELWQSIRRILALSGKMFPYLV